jgi:hypothetical protein
MKPKAVILEGKTLRVYISPESQFGAWKAWLTQGKWHLHCATVFRNALGNELATYVMNFGHRVTASWDVR